MLRQLLASLLVLYLTSQALAGDWPMWRGNAARSGYTDQQLPSDLSLVWRHQSPHQPQRAWPRSDRQQFDACYQPVVFAGRLFYGSSVDCQIYCLDASTGAKIWTFFTGGPVRFAPLAWQDRVAVASDDGYLYVLDAASGEVVWRHRGGPQDLFRLGNGRMISKWPARGGPVLLDGVLYYAAGIWPSDGIYIYALDAATGKELWSNRDSGSIYMPQPHGGANAASGLAAQGHLVADGDRLFVPTGRAVPAALDRQTGKFAFFHLQQNRAAGGSFAAAIGGRLFNSGLAFDADDGKLLGKIGYSAVAEFPGGFVAATANSVRAHRWTEVVKPDRKGKPVKTTVAQTLWSETSLPAGSSMIVAGDTVVVGGPERVTLLDRQRAAAAKEKQTRKLWSNRVAGRACGLAVADSRLYVSTDQGAIYCFASGETPQPPVAPTRQKRDADDPIVTQAVDEILKKTKMREGYCLDLGCGDGRLALELAKRTNLTIFAVDDDPLAVAKARQRLNAAGLYGTRVTVHLADLKANGYPRYFANLIVSSRSLDEGSQFIDRDVFERLQRPFGGIVCIGKPSEMEVQRRGELAGAGSWTHQYANPANTVCSDDELVSGSLGILWFRDFDLELPSRHGRGPAPLFHQGRLFHEGLDELRAVDAYNGRELWSYRLSGVLRPYDGDHLMGTAGTGSNFCVSDEGVFVRYEGVCLRIDASTGRPVGEFSIPNADDKTQWGYIACEGGRLFGTRADPNHVVTYRYRPGGDLNKQLTESDLLFAHDVESQKLLWQYDAEHSIRHNAIAIGSRFIYLIDRPQAAVDRTRSAKARVDQHPPGTLVAIDKETGKIAWRREQVFGTTLAISNKHNVLLMSYQNTRFKLASELGGRLAAFDAETGKPLWDSQAKYNSRLTINDRTIYGDGGAWDLLTGQSQPFNLKRSYGCGVLSASKDFFFFRSATLGFFDVTKNKQVQNFGGIRPGCWINAIPAGGLVLVPDASARCTCSYLNQCWFALEPRDEP